MAYLDSRSIRRLRYHVLIGTAAVALTLVFMALFPKRDWISRASIGTAYPALFLTAAAMLLGPLNILLGKPNPPSLDLRRDLGIWAGVWSLAHTVVGLNVHLRGKMWLYFVDLHRHLRRDLFGFGNYTGAVAAAIFVLLLALSNDASLRLLGTARWKSLQRWTYAAIVLTAAHAIAYQQIEKRIPPFQAVLYIVFAILLAVQITGFVQYRKKH